MYNKLKRFFFFAWIYMGLLLAPWRLFKKYILRRLILKSCQRLSEENTLSTNIYLKIGSHKDLIATTWFICGSNACFSRVNSETPNVSLSMPSPPRDWERGEKVEVEFRPRLDPEANFLSSKLDVK